MSFLDRFFPKLVTVPPDPDVVFGRYTDAYKTAFQKVCWTRSLELFDNGKPLEAYEELLRFMRDEEVVNVEWEIVNGVLSFHFLQGSRRVDGRADSERIRVESRIAWADDLNVAFMRRLAEQNFRLRYSRFALTEDNCLSIVFDSSTRDGAPMKLLQAFRELSINADKQDDLLVEEFRVLRRVDEPGTVWEIPLEEKSIKIAYFRSEVTALLEALALGQPDPGRFPGGYVYLMLGTAFRLDYLIRPEGYLMDLLERIYQLYFAKDSKTPASKILLMKELFEKGLERSDEQLAGELYKTRATFGISPAVGHDRVQALLEAELPKMDWHIEQKHPEIMALAIAKYAVGYGLYHYSPPPPDKALFHLFFQITEASFFQELGYSVPFWRAEGGLNKERILDAIRGIVKMWRSEYPGFKLELNELRFETLPLFAKSYLTMIKNSTLVKQPSQ